MFHQTLRSFMALFLVQFFTVTGYAQSGGGDGSSSNAAKEPPAKHQLYRRHFLIRYNPELLPLSNTLLAASLSDELIERALAAVEINVEKNIESTGPIENRQPLKSLVSFHTYTVGRGGGGGFGGRVNRIIFLDETNMPKGTRVCYLNFECDSNLDPKVRMEIWKRVVMELQALFQKEQLSAYEEQRKLQRASYNVPQQKRDESLANLKDAMERHINLQVNAGTSADQLREALQNASKEMRRIKMELSGEDALRHVLNRRIAILREEASVASKEDEICRELKSIVELQESSLQLMIEMHKAQQVPSNEVESAKIALANARIDYLRSRKQASQSAGAEELAALNRELADQSMQAVKQKAILQAIQIQSHELKDQLQEQLRAEMEMKRIKQQTDLLENQIAMLSKQLAKLELEDQPPQPIIITPWGK